MRRLNLVFLMGVVMALLVLGGAAYLVHGRQVQRHTSALLDRARKAEALQNAEKLGRKPCVLDPLDFAIFQRSRKNCRPGDLADLKGGGNDRGGLPSMAGDSTIPKYSVKFSFRTFAG